MAGHIRGMVECYYNTINSSQSLACAYVMANLYTFFSNHSNCTIISSNYGHADNGAGFVVGTSFSYPSSSDGIGNNAWFVVRMNATASRAYDIYHLFQMCPPTAPSGAPYNGASFGTAPGNPGLIHGGVTALGIGHACAVGIGGTGGSTLSVTNGYGNPWKGTSNNNGADTKGTTVWGTPTSGTSMLSWPRSNTGFGGTAAFAQNCVIVGGNFDNNSNNINPIRFHILADDDSWLVAINQYDQGNYALSSCGIYVPKPNLVTLSGPLVNVYQFGVSNAFLPLSYADQSVYGSTAGNTVQEGGVGGLIANGIRGLQLDQLPIFMKTIQMFPNQQNGNTFDENDIPIYSYDNNGDFSGALGRIDFIRQTFNIATDSVKSDYSRLYIGITGTLNQTYSIPWDNVNNTVPRSGTTAQGISFVSVSP